MLASIVGFYSLPFFRRLKPEIHDTPMTKIIGNCAVILIMSSALPVLSRTLGTMDLNFYFVKVYDCVCSNCMYLCKNWKKVMHNFSNQINQKFLCKIIIMNFIYLLQVSPTLTLLETSGAWSGSATFILYFFTT